MEIKVGTILFVANVLEPSGKVEWQEWHVRTIRGGWTHATWKIEASYGKLSKKIGDFGWKDPTPEWCRTKWRSDEDPPAWNCFGTTKEFALQAQIYSMKHFAEDSDYAGITVAEIVAKLERMLAREKAK